ncbi:uncharacterized protein LOC112242341 isoform X3 [Oncorhynchus tshawytscha]|uniref:uncharacterized protein LOC112242341 isoform X3 n=1 Tax=Oncorhynchus tshawytscha TaxID=74940 RepID=UPI001C3D7F77|nr:uncharacterized protein LOC112242341 isoform X3 [Oncorhynchus tshawytscha]XP_042172443.1 uncharacterized protein LOC112242341 isoform X3 [Oncorhynchus tshawytscha]
METWFALCITDTLDPGVGEGRPPPLVSQPRNICMGKPEESDSQRRWSYGPSPPDPSVPGLGEGRPPPPVPHPRKINMSKPEESKPQRRWSYGPSSPSHTSGPGVDRGRKPGTAQKPPPVTQNKWSVGRNPPQEGGCDPPDGGSVSEFIKKFEAKEDQNKQLVVRCPVGPPAVIYREDSVPPLYEKVLATQETRMFGSPAFVDREESNDYIYEEVFVTHETRTVAVQQRICATYVHCVRPPPPLPLKQSLPLKGRIKTLSKSSISEEEKDNIKDADHLMEWWEKVKREPWKDLSKDPKLAKKGEAKLFKEKAQRFQNALQLYNLLLTKHGETLKNHIIDLISIADNLDKVSKGTKIAGITGGATGAVGGVAAAAGVILAPFTLGASLALTVVGVGVAAAGGVTGASAVIANKVSSAQDRKKIELILQDYLALMGDIEACLRFINVGMEHLRKHNLSTLQEVDTEAVRVVRVAIVTGVGSSSAIDASSKASGMLQGFALGMDIYFTQKEDGKGGPKLKKGLESKFGRKIREVAQQLNEGLDEVIKVKYELVENNLIL